MITKLCHFSAVSKDGEKLVQVYRPGELIKTASPFLPAVQAYLDKIRPDANKIYVLVNALGAGEYWGSNINADYFPEAALIHPGPEYGYETFYSAHPFTHHQNKDPEKSFGSVVLSAWNDDMKRVELIIEIDRVKAQQVGATSVCDKIDKGIFSDVSMGCRVAFDNCSVCTDWKRYKEAQQTFDPDKHKNVAAAVLEIHKKAPIRGVSVTRDDYCECLKKRLNKILEDGRRVCANNDYPKFFDISFVFIGADKTAKVMAKLANIIQVPLSYDIVPSWKLAEDAEYVDTMEKAASVESPGRLIPRSKVATQVKASEILKDVVPSQFGGKAIPVDHEEADLPDKLLDSLGGSNLSEALSTASSMGIMLKPREFQRIVIISGGNKPLADKLDQEGTLFPPVKAECGPDCKCPCHDMGPNMFSGLIKNLLMPHMEDRSLLEPVAKRKIIHITISGMPKQASKEMEYEYNDPLLNKIAASYNTYLDRFVTCYSKAADIVNSDAELWSAVTGNKTISLFTKEAAVNPAVVAGSAGGAYILSRLADWEKKRAEKGERDETGPLTNIAADHPISLALIAALAALHQQGSDIPGKLLNWLIGGKK